MEPLGLTKLRAGNDLGMRRRQAWKDFPPILQTLVFHQGMCIGKGIVTASGLTSALPPQGGQLEMWLQKISTARLSGVFTGFICLFGSCFRVGFSHVFNYLSWVKCCLQNWDAWQWLIKKFQNLPIFAISCRLNGKLYKKWTSFMTFWEVGCFSAHFCNYSR